MSRLSIAYQCWEMGPGSTMGYTMAQGQSHSNSSPDTSFANFQMYVQAQQDPKGQALPTTVAAVRFSSSPICNASPPPTLSLVSEPQHPQQPAASGSNVTTSSVTTEGDEKLTSSGSDGSMTMLGGVSNYAAAPSSPPNRAVRGKVVRTKSKAGVVERIVPITSYGGYAYGSATKNVDSSESSSSICQASEDSGSCSSDTGGEEAQSAYRGPLTKGALSALEESLPIKRPGLSKFFGGKSRSFSSLAEVSSVAELAKPNNPYAKRQKMAFNCPLRDKNRSYPPPTRSSGTSIAKRLPSSGSRNTLAVAVILGGLREEHHEDQSPSAPSTMRAFEKPTFPPRSYSLTDLPHAGSPPPPPPPPRRAVAGPP